MENYYKTLGVSRHSNMEEIKRAYFKILKTYHPDVYTGDKQYGEKVTTDANIAYTFLCEPSNKRRLDNYLENIEKQNNKKENESATKTNKQTQTANIKQKKETSFKNYYNFFKDIISKKKNEKNNQTKKKNLKDKKVKKISEDSRTKCNS